MKKIPIGRDNLKAIEVIEKKNAKTRITLERGGERESISLKTRKNETCKKVGLLREAKNRNLKENLCGKMGVYFRNFRHGNNTPLPQPLKLYFFTAMVNNICII